MASALIALGGNVGDVKATFVQAIAEICRRAEAVLVARSSDYITPPWGEVQQPPFVNACIAVETSVAPHPLLTILHDVERLFGRDRTRETRWGPRTLDLDLIAYDDVTLDTPDLILPHPRLFERGFVLVPLAEIVPERRISGRRVCEALRGVSRDGIQPLPSAE
ncbi:2-amino-4-hydroxy-6-hydroxymethyldihydropteridinepyrophosphokinase (7,8-dihydro-6-hydroxymethylpterin-pyrophosphokinase) (HPPK) (6-hydroxymethyl-7,8-dihydropterin pyrophosphokinase) (PPPK) [Bradyrhizobium sp. ORS 375]|uniref:2-amino-4-hydroxy-6- hydroxymethyldihydropteridine diphosphokinase n=1 Tax=Bradyrhizobium sp. (strain ORS 375) TaxID=566679 RepID=UPI0002407A50|nr:2-amino-4-hydroxy-6-hydroxymethyldihydropteridine diphosphokinase [Bradyrhizobium sp. ORS 375]CCD93170.1 2-amino-4-hydroxy-6-hydroxymethyldihydropteridinepyrophosphokinase (7,8-dihydro-6-hydroxymethylpterin-pyrophosphokinase) (HPPK) (6-hydroxymethyl-7,8-dihydropterin pyrophosphokinase) (PPPK) [Bradyrhizobium sp. ORS 375]